MSYKVLDILIVVDTEGALSTNSLKDNVYMVDTNKFLGSWNQGSNNLVSICQDGQQVNWRVVSISTDNNSEITSMSGEMVSKKICIPKSTGSQGENSWQGIVESKGDFGPYNYTIEISIDDKKMSFSSVLKIV